MSTITQRAFSLYLQGMSLRKLQSHFNIPKETLSYRFRKLYGKDYTLIKNVAPVVKEYLKSPDLSPEDKQLIQQWFNSPELINKLLDIGTNTRLTKLYTQTEIEFLTINECGHGAKDWREVFDTFKY